MSRVRFIGSDVHRRRSGPLTQTATAEGGRGKRGGCFEMMFGDHMHSRKWEHMVSR